MSEEAKEKLLLEEQKNAFEHIRFLEARRDRLVIGSLTASGAVLAFIAQVLSKDDFRLWDASNEFIVVLSLLCLSLGVLSWFLRRAYISLSPVITHHVAVIGNTRSVIFGEKAQELKWLDIRENKEVTQGRTPVSCLSECILSCLCTLWFLAGVGLLVFLFTRCQ